MATLWKLKHLVTTTVTRLSELFVGHHAISDDKSSFSWTYFLLIGVLVIVGIGVLFVLAFAVIYVVRKKKVETINRPSITSAGSAWTYD